MIYHLVLDLETLDTTPSSVILSLGCSLFSFEEEISDFKHYVDAGFYVKFKANEQIKLGRTTSKDTISWWKKQGKEAQKVLMPSDEDKSFAAGLLLFAQYLKQSNYDYKRSYCWCRGSSFDWPIVDDAHRMANLTLPYNGWKIRDIKTAIDIMNGVDNGAYNLKNGTPPEFIKHDSLHDCAMDILRMKELYFSMI